MPNRFRSYLLLLSASWAILSIVRLQPLQFSSTPSPWLCYALPAVLTGALCFRPPEGWSRLGWFLTSAAFLTVAGLLSWFPIVLFHLGIGPPAGGTHVVTLLLSAAVFWLASRPAGCFERCTTPMAFAMLSAMSPLLLYHVTADAGFPVHVEASQSYGPYDFVVERRGSGGPVHAGMQISLIREKRLPVPGLVWRRNLGPLRQFPKFSPTEMLLMFPDRRIPLEQLTGNTFDESKM